MAVTITQMWSRDGVGIANADANIARADFAITTAYQIVTDSSAENSHDNVLTEAIAAGLPWIGDDYPDTDLVAKVVDVRVSRVAPILWVAEVVYTGAPSTEGNSTEVEWSDIVTTEPIDQDWYGRAITNVNGEYVDGLTMDVSDTQLVLRRRFFSVNVPLLNDYKHSTNSDYFFGFAPGMVRLVNYSAKAKFSSTGAQQGLWDVTARFQIRYPYKTTPDKAWYKRYRNEGYGVMVVTPAGPSTRGTGIARRKRAVDFFKVESTSPVLLKETGEEETEPENAVWLYAQVYGSLPYSNLGF